MTIESHITSLELSKRLHEFDMKQESYFYWRNHNCDENKDHWDVWTDGEFDMHTEEWCVGEKNSPEIYPAYLASELLEMLPDKIYIDFHYCYLKTQKKDNEYKIYIDYSDKVIIFFSENLANACAKMLIYLIEQGHVKND